MTDDFIIREVLTDVWEEDALHALDRLVARLAAAEKALREAYPYVNGATHSDQPWRRETATEILARIDAALHPDSIEDTSGISDPYGAA